jgi:hypothetical protein
MSSGATDLGFYSVFPNKVTKVQKATKTHFFVMTSNMKYISNKKTHLMDKAEVSLPMSFFQM